MGQKWSRGLVLAGLTHHAVAPRCRIIECGGGAQEQRELVTLIPAQRRRVLDHLLDIGVKVVIVSAVRGAVSVTVTLGGAAVIGHLA
jgi:hypothetical protein